MKSLYLSATLQASEAPVWRRFSIPMHYSFDQLHEVMQILFGYLGNEAYEFVIDEPKLRITVDADLYERYRFLVSDEGKAYLKEKAEEGHVIDTSVEIAWAEALPLDPLILKQPSFRYIYDMCDEWTYDIALVDILEDGPAVPVLREGLGSAPFEACGGFAGYYELVDILTSTDDPQKASLQEWMDAVGYRFYDADDVNAALAAYGEKGQK